MVRKLEFKVLARPEDVRPSSPLLKVIGIFNPAAVRVGKEIFLLARVAEGAIEEKEGFKTSPRYRFTPSGPVLEIDRISLDGPRGDDVRLSSGGEGFARLSFISHLRLIRLDPTGFNVLSLDDSPSFRPQEEYEEFGIEDPRMTDIDGEYYFTYVAVSRDWGVATALASTRDFREFRRHGIIFCRENKDAVILPGMFEGRYCAFHRPVGAMKTAPPNMMSAFSPDLIHWGQHKVLMTPRAGMWDSDRIGAGTVPIRTDRGFLAVYHGVEVVEQDGPIGIYRAGAALFDLDDPSRCIARSRKPILSPEDPSETEGFVRNVVFPTAGIPDSTGENLILYCGGADSVVTAIKVSIAEIMESLEPV